MSGVYSAQESIAVEQSWRRPDTTRKRSYRARAAFQIANKEASSGCSNAVTQIAKMRRLCLSSHALIGAPPGEPWGGRARPR